MTRRDVADLYSSMRDQRTVLRSHTSGGKKESPLEIILRTAKVGFGSGLVGYIAGATGSAGIGGSAIPLGLTAAVVGHGLAMFDLVPGGKHIHDLSDGFFAGWTAIWGAGQGTLMRQKSGAPVGPIAAGLVPQSQAQDPRTFAGHNPNFLPAGVPQRPLSEADLEAISYRYARR